MGGGQERDRRSGTHNVAGIVAMAAAMKATAASRDATVARIAALRDRLLDGLLAEVDGLRETVPRDRKVAGSAHVCIEGVENEALLFLLDREGVCASAASACSSGAMDPSHVLAAMGLPGTSRPGRCACRSDGRPATPTSTACSRCCRPPSPGCRRRALVG